MLRRLTGRPRRILMTLDAVGGVWQYALALSAELKRGGLDLVFVGMGPEPGAEQRREAEALGTLLWLKIPPDWLASDEAELEGLGDELAGLVRDHAIELVHLNAPSQAAGLRLPCPVVAMSHSCVTTWFRAVRGEQPRGSWAWHVARNRAGMEAADMTVAPSASHAAMLADCYGPVPRLAVVHNAVAPGLQSPTREEVVFAAARWWDEGKNGGVLDAASAISSWPVLAAGPVQGPNAETFTFRNATALGPLPHEQTRRRMGRAGIFISPSLYEPFGLAALEAADAATPLVLADIPTYRELWDGAALFFPAKDADALARALNRLAGEPERRAALGRAARERAARFTPGRQAAATRAVYGQAVGAHADRR